MLFNSYVFIFAFLPITLIGYYWFGKRGLHRFAIAWLFLASLFYYGWWNPIYLLLILGSILFNFTCGYWLGRQTQSEPGPSKVLLCIGISFNLLLLGYFKYTDFFILNFNWISGQAIPLKNIILPLAISFFTFQQIAFLMDAYEGKTREYNFLNYCLFVTFFPQLIAGPIVHHKEILPQYDLKETYRFDHSNLAVGLTIFSIGLFKKVILADNLGQFATPIFGAASDGHIIHPGSAWIGTLSYTFQIYFDFSGYSDMAIGLARLFAIKLPINFNSPYKAVNIIEFWRRWHMTLSRFLKDYLYIPLGGNRKGKIRRYINLLLVMLLGGWWHGAAWTFIMWGGVHGLFLMGNHLFQNYGRRKQWTWTNTFYFRYGRIAFTFFCLTITWVLFRSESLASALNIYQGMFGLRGDGFIPYGIEVDHIMANVVSLVLVWILPNTQEFLRAYEPAVDFDASTMNALPGWFQNLKWKPSKVWGFVISIIFIISAINLLKVSEFLYYQF